MIKWKVIWKSIYYTCPIYIWICQTLINQIHSYKHGYLNANFYSSSWHYHLCQWMGGCFELLYFLFEHSILIVRKALYRLFMFNYLFRHRRSGFYADSKRYKSEQKKIEQRYTISLFGQLTFWDVNVNNVVSLVTSYQKAYWAFNAVKIWWEEKL